MKFQTPKGTRDLMPEDAAKMQKVIDTARSVFESYGFLPLFTPAFESFELLSAKGGLGEAVKDEIYYFKDKSDRELGLRFDLTMPLARVVVSNPQIPKPFKRYAIGKVWRYDQPQAMRWREFWQADVDVIGSRSTLADAECLEAICECLNRLGFESYYIRINNRKLMQTIFGKLLGSDKEKIVGAFRTIDKLEKISEDNVKEELKSNGVSDKNIEKIFKLIKISGSNKSILSKIKKKYGENEGVKELAELLKYAKIFGIGKKLKIDLSLVRGLDYYTGLVFEVSLGEKVSCGGGGRYDNLMGVVGGASLPATGISLGLDRIVEVMKDTNLFEKRESSVKVFVANVGETIKDAINIASKLRKRGISTQTDLMDRDLTKQLEYADSSAIPYVVIVGEEELRKKKFKLKDMIKKTEVELSLMDIIRKLK